MACDKAISWGYLKEALHIRGFDSKYTDWIMRLLVWDQNCVNFDGNSSS